MANKPIPELPEITIDDLEASNLTILETGIATFKLRISTLVAFLRNLGRTNVTLVLTGSETGEQVIDVTSYEIDATLLVWMLRDPNGWQIPTARIRATDEVTLVVDLGLFTMDAGTYSILGV